MLSLAALCISLFLFYVSISVPVFADPSVASVQFTAAINAAMTQLVSDSSFKQAIANINVPFTVPLCSQSVPNYPTTNPIPSNITQLVICSQLVETNFDAWSSVYKVVGKGIVAQLNKQYGLSLTANFLSVNTSSGFFQSLQSAVNSGICDFVVADTAISATRAQQVNFATCAYGFTYFAFLRTDLDNTTITGITTLAQLNRTDIKVGWYSGTLSDTTVATNLTAVQKFPTATSDALFLLAQNKQVHVILYDQLDLYSWQVTNAQSCGNCYLNVFGDPLTIAIYTANTVSP